MKLIRHGEPGKEKPGVILADGSLVDVSAFGGDYDEAFFASGGTDTLFNAGFLPRFKRSHFVTGGPPGAADLPA